MWHFSWFLCTTSTRVLCFMDLSLVDQGKGECLKLRLTVTLPEPGHTYPNYSSPLLGVFWGFCFPQVSRLLIGRGGSLAELSSPVRDRGLTFLLTLRSRLCTGWGLMRAEEGKAIDARRVQSPCSRYASDSTSA